MANVAATKTVVHPGHSEENVRRVILSAASLPNGDVLVGTIAELLGASWVPSGMRAFTYGAGAQGARTLTPAALTLVITDYVETTGVLRLTNGTGGGLTGLVVVVEFVPGIATPA